MYLVKRGKHVLSKHDTEEAAQTAATPECRVIHRVRHNRNKKYILQYRDYDNSIRYAGELRNFPHFMFTSRRENAVQFSYEEALRYVKRWEIECPDTVSMIKCI